MSTIPPPPAFHSGRLPHRGPVILTLGIVSLAVNLLAMVGGLAFPPCCFGTLLPVGLAIPSWVMANRDLPLMATGQMDPAGMSATSAGRVCAIVSIALSLLAVLATIAVLVFGLAIFGIAIAGARP